jgi:hypothetical protein
MEVAGLVPEAKSLPMDYPAELETDEEREIYARVVGASASPHLFNSSVAPLAVQYVRHYIASNDLAEVIRGMDKVKDPRLFIAALKAQKDETLAMCQISSRLKFGGASVANHRGHMVKVEKPKPKPWEFNG